MQTKSNKITLAYHSVGDCPVKEVGASLYTVSLIDFRAQMECIRGADIAITFDDGDMTNYLYAFPVLKELGLTGYFFIIGTRVGTEGYMGWKEIKELRDAGMVIGSHGMTHNILTELGDDELNYELVQSRKILQDALNISVDSFSIPRGFCNDKVLVAAKDAGYAEIFTSDNRIGVKPSWDIEHFKKVLNGGYSLGDKLEKAVKGTFRTILGTKNYDKLRTALLNK